jgi:4-hydroxybutyrate CoA-transferase
MSWQEDYRRKVVSIEDAAKLVQSGDMVVTALGVGACSPDIYNAILDRHEELEDVVISDTVQLRPCKLYDPDFMAQIDGRINHAPAFGMITIRKMHRAFLSDFFPAPTYSHSLGPPSKTYKLGYTRYYCCFSSNLYK